MSDIQHRLLGPDIPGPEKPMPNPTPEQLASPEFQAVWDCIKTWDVNVPEFYSGYCGANGSHVVMILDALGLTPDAPGPVRQEGESEDEFNARKASIEAAALEARKDAQDPDAVTALDKAASVWS